MQTIITLTIMLFVYPWSNSNSNTDKLLFEGMYTLTGRGYNEMQEYDSPAGCQAFYVKVYEKKIIATISVYGTAEYQDIEYNFEKIDDRSNRIYRKDKTDAFVVDSEHNLQKIISTYTYNGNKRTDTYCEVIKGDYSADCLKRTQDALERERLKTTMDMDSWY